MRPLPDHVPSRVVIEAVEPSVDDGRFPAKRTRGDEVAVEADVYADGHEALAAVVRYRKAGATEWTEVPMAPTANDRWAARFPVTDLGFYEYTIQAWIDRFAGWRRDLGKKVDAGLNVASELLDGAALVRETAERVRGTDRGWLCGQATLLEGEEADLRVRAALDPALAAVMARHADRRSGSTFD